MYSCATIATALNSMAKLGFGCPNNDIIVPKTRDTKKSLHLTFASIETPHVEDVAALVPPNSAVTSWVVAQFSAALQRKQLSDLLEQLLLIRYRAENLQATSPRAFSSELDG